MGRSTPKTLVIPSDVSAASGMSEQIMAEVQTHGYSENSQFAIRLALDEAITNAIHHGNGNDPSKSVQIQYYVDPEEVFIQVEDAVNGFKPDTISDPTLEPNLQLTNGRGVMLMRAYMTQVSFNDRGNCVTMVKRRDCQLPVGP